MCVSPAEACEEATLRVCTDANTFLLLPAGDGEPGCGLETRTVEPHRRKVDCGTRRNAPLPHWHGPLKLTLQEVSSYADARALLWSLRAAFAINCYVQGVHFEWMTPLNMSFLQRGYPALKELKQLTLHLWFPLQPCTERIWNRFFPSSFRGCEWSASTTACLERTRRSSLKMKRWVITSVVSDKSAFMGIFICWNLTLSATKQLLSTLQESSFPTLHRDNREETFIISGCRLW